VTFFIFKFIKRGSRSPLKSVARFFVLGACLVASFPGAASEEEGKIPLREAYPEVPFISREDLPAEYEKGGIPCPGRENYF